MLPGEMTMQKGPRNPYSIEICVRKFSNCSSSKLEKLTDGIL